MLILLVNWILSAVSLIIAAHVIPGFSIKGFGSALIAAIVIGFINATFGLILKILTIPISILTFGLFLLVINAIMIQLSSKLVAGFDVNGFLPAFFGSIVLSILNMILKSLVFGY